MKIFLAITVIFIVQSPNYCQDYFDINNTTSIEKCTFDSTMEVVQYLNWDVYQTLDENPDGIRDSVCHSLLNFDFKLSEVDVARPLFIRLKKNRISALNLKLAPNSVYTINYSINSSLQSIKENVNCDLGTCSNIAITTRYPAEDSLNYVYSTTEYIGNVNHNGCVFSDEFCFATSKLDSQSISDILITVYFDENVSGNAILFLDYFYGTMLYELIEISEPLPLQNLSIEINTLPIRLRQLAQGHFFDNNYLVVHDKIGYPNALNYDIKTISISPNPEEQTTIVLTVDPYESLFFQEYTGFGTTLVEGSDTLFHKLDIVQNGGNMCLQSVELVIDHDVEFQYKSGDLSFSNKTTCMAFREGSVFTIKENSYLKYGEHGNGMLGLNNALINIESGGHLQMDGTLILNGKGRSDSEIHLDLGSNLSFSEHANILNVGSETETVKVFGNKKQIHIDNLSPGDRQKIIIVEPEVVSTNEKAWFFPNPSNDVVHIISKDNLDTHLFDSIGKCIYTTKGQIMDVNTLPQGIYYIKSGYKVGKLIIVN